MQFSWDPIKAATNVRKHRVTFEEAVTVFADPLALLVDDGDHPDRFILIGESHRGRHLYVVFAEVEEEVTRIISARRVTLQERRRYENGE